MTGANPNIARRPDKRITRCATPAAAFMAALFFQGPSGTAEALPGAALHLEMAHASDLAAGSADELARAQSRWLPLREALRFLRQETREVLLFAHDRDSGFANGLRRRLEARGRRFETVTAADGPVPVLDLLRAVRARTAVPPDVAVFLGSADADAGTPLPQYTRALEEMIASLAARGASLERMLLVAPPAGDEAARGYRDRLLAAARERGALAADFNGALSPEAAADALAQAVLAAAAPHPSLLLLPLYPVFSVALLWLWRRSRF